ncbi:hypothetical protein ACSQ67_023991 [Phaseolus vulgaris]
MGWRRFEVDTEASSEEGSVGASLSVSRVPSSKWLEAGMKAAKEVEEWRSTVVEMRGTKGSKVESVSPPLMAKACIPNNSKATTEWGGRSIDEGSSCFGERGLRNIEEELIGRFSDRGGKGSNVEGVFQGVLQAMGEAHNEALNKEVGGKVLEGCNDAANEALAEGFLLEHLGSKSWVGESIRPGISLEVSELGWSKGG